MILIIILLILWIACGIVSSCVRAYMLAYLYSSSQTTFADYVWVVYGPIGMIPNLSGYAELRGKITRQR